MVGTGTDAPPRPVEGEAGRWDRVVEAHLRILRRIHPPAVLEVLAHRAGFPIDKVIGNGAASYVDVLHYLNAVRDTLGQAAWVSAKLTTTNRMRESGLAPALPQTGRGAAPSGTAPGGGRGEAE